MFQHPYNPSRYKRANEYVARGRLRSLANVLLRKQMRLLSGHTTNRRPLGWKERWLHFYTNKLYRNGYQSRRHAELFARFKAFVGRR